MSWSTERIKLEVYELVRRVKLLGNAFGITINGISGLSAQDVQAALEELKALIDGLSVGAAPVYEYTFTNVTNETILSATHGIPTVSSVTFLNTANEEISVYYKIVSNNVEVESNISLLNHKIIIS